MKINQAKIYLASALILLCGTLRAQEIKGVVVDSDEQPLFGASVYWAGTTVGTSTGLSGEFTLHRVKGRDRLVASFLGCTNDTLRVESGAGRLVIRLQPDGLAVEDVVIEGTQRGNFVKSDGIAKNEMISFAGLCKMACCNLAESFENSASVTVGYSDAISGARRSRCSAWPAPTPRFSTRTVRSCAV